MSNPNSKRSRHRSSSGASKSRLKKSTNRAKSGGQPEKIKCKICFPSPTHLDPSIILSEAVYESDTDNEQAMEYHSSKRSRHARSISDVSHSSVTAMANSRHSGGLINKYNTNAESNPSNAAAIKDPTYEQSQRLRDCHRSRSIDNISRDSEAGGVVSKRTHRMVKAGRSKSSNHVRHSLTNKFKASKAVEGSSYEESRRLKDSHRSKSMGHTSSQEHESRTAKFKRIRRILESARSKGFNRVRRSLIHEFNASLECDDNNERAVEDMANSDCSSRIGEDEDGRSPPVAQPRRSRRDTPYRATKHEEVQRIHVEQTQNIGSVARTYRVHKKEQPSLIPFLSLKVSKPVATSRSRKRRQRKSAKQPKQVEPQEPAVQEKPVYPCYNMVVFGLPSLKRIKTDYSGGYPELNGLNLPESEIEDFKRDNFAPPRMDCDPDLSSDDDSAPVVIEPQGEFPTSEDEPGPSGLQNKSSKGVKEPTELRVSEEESENDRETATSFEREQDVPRLLPRNLSPDTCGVIMTRDDYYIVPPLKDLAFFKRSNGNCIIEGLIIGRTDYGHVFFPDPVNIAGLNIDEIVHFERGAITVYPDPDKKPPVGEGLNRTAKVTLEKIYPKSKSSAEITDVSVIVLMNFIHTLRLVCDREDLTFISYIPRSGEWIFHVDHFCTYGLNERDFIGECNQVGQFILIEDLVSVLTCEMQAINETLDALKNSLDKLRNQITLMKVRVDDSLKINSLHSAKIEEISKDDPVPLL
ncbi:hypothetical protein Trydic_g2696 [Trypoxylus dichotomus]